MILPLISQQLVVTVSPLRKLQLL